ncbi:MAG: hypothetical protein QNJ33_19905 [Crocosphaera sp.]|nr:hypothetical protein [Crocosphaera sp.]
MNSYQHYCYAHAFDDPRYWDGIFSQTRQQSKQLSSECLELTQQLYAEIKKRGYV